MLSRYDDLITHLSGQQKALEVVRVAVGSFAAQLYLPVNATAASVYTALVAVVLSTSWLFVTHRRRARTVLGHIVNRSEVAA